MVMRSFGNIERAISSVACCPVTIGVWDICEPHVGHHVRIDFDTGSGVLTINRDFPEWCRDTDVNAWVRDFVWWFNECQQN